MYDVWENNIALILSYTPYAYLFIVAFQKELRFSKKVTLGLLIGSTLLRLILSDMVAHISSDAVILYNYMELFLVMGFGLFVAKTTFPRMLFVLLILKNTADALVIIAKFAEYVVNPEWAYMGYNWTYSVSLFLCECVALPLVYIVIKKYFTHGVRETIAQRWQLLWIIPFFFYLTWIYVFYFSSEKSNLELACMPIHSAFLICSIICQFFIYICLATLVQSLQNEKRLQEENHAIQLQTLQYESIREQINEDRKLWHDLRHHIAAISSMAEQQDYNRLSAYLAEYAQPTLWHSQIQFCSNTVLNIMASYYANKSAVNHINCMIVLDLPEQLPLSDTEITILFGNLLENAFEACTDIPQDDERQIVFRGNIIQNTLLFSVENTYATQPQRTRSGGFISTKHKGRGMGISSCKDIIQKHNGSMEFIIDDMFRVHILMGELSAAL